MKARPYIGRILMKSVFRYFQGSGNMALMLPILELAKQASGSSDLSAEIGARMRFLAAQYRDLTEAPSGTANWTEWYDLIDRRDSWRTDKPAQAFYNIGRGASTQIKKAAEVAKSPY